MIGLQICFGFNLCLFILTKKQKVKEDTLNKQENLINSNKQSM